MKVYLDFNTNKIDTASDYIPLSADYENDMTSTDILNIFLAEDDEGVDNSDNMANLVSKTLQQAMAVGHLNDSFLTAFKGSLVVQYQWVYVSFT